MHQQHNLQQDQDDDHQLEELAAGDGGLLDGEAVDVVDRFELVADVRLPLVEAEAGGSEADPKTTIIGRTSRWHPPARMFSCSISGLSRRT